MKNASKFSQRPTVEMSLEDIQALLMVEDAVARRDAAVHTRPTVSMEAVRAGVAKGACSERF